MSSPRQFTGPGTPASSSAPVIKTPGRRTPPSTSHSEHAPSKPLRSACHRFASAED
ncbi:hypothetical protein B0H16DRAFT_1746959 [Mycena metata]|nr:hypothetical protein B0H16DRAFT_1746959 [Mycena metata]